MVTKYPIMFRYLFAFKLLFPRDLLYSTFFYGRDDRFVFILSVKQLNLRVDQNMLVLILG